MGAQAVARGGTAPLAPVATALCESPEVFVKMPPGTVTFLRPLCRSPEEKKGLRTETKHFFYEFRLGLYIDQKKNGVAPKSVTIDDIIRNVAGGTIKFRGTSVKNHSVRQTQSAVLKL